MQVRLGESQPMTVGSGRWSGVLISAEMLGAVNDFTLQAADWNTAGTQIQVLLQRNGAEYTIFNNNLLLLGTYNMKKNNYERFINGIDLRYDAAGIKHSKLRTAFLKFRSPIALSGRDRLVVQVTFNTGFSANVDAGNSFLDFMLSPSTGQEIGIPETRFQVVQTAADSGTYVQTDGVRHIAFMNFDKNDWSSPVIQNCSLSSDRLNYNATYKQLIASDSQKWAETIPYRFGTALPISATTPTVFRGLEYLPQSLTIFESGRGEGLNNAVVSLTFDPANVAAAQNYVGYDTIKMAARRA